MFCVIIIFGLIAFICGMVFGHELHVSLNVEADENSCDEVIEQPHGFNPISLKENDWLRSEFMEK